jgi:hypothetical protein
MIQSKKTKDELVPPEPISQYLNALSILCAMLGVLYAIQAFLPKSDQVLQRILLALPYGVTSGAVLYCLNSMTSSYYTDIASRVYGIPITPVALAANGGVIGFIIAYTIARFAPIRQQEWAKGTFVVLAFLAACLSIYTSLFAFDVINLRFHWFTGILAITIGVIFVLTGAIARFIRQFTKLQIAQQGLQSLADARVQEADPPDDDDESLDGDETLDDDDESLDDESHDDTDKPSTLRFRGTVRQQANLPTRLYRVGGFIIGMTALYASVNLFGFVILLYSLALTLAQVAALLAVLAVQRRVIARLPTSGVAIVSIILVLIAIAGQIFRAF